MMHAAASGETFGIEIIAMTKRFGAFTALDNVSLSVAAGSFHALLGENGAGKSTLVKCIMGFYRPDDGDVLVGEHEQAIGSTRDAQRLGIGMVYQHFTLVPGMTVLENLVLARTDLPKVIDWKAEAARVDDFMTGMPFRIPLDRPVSRLAAGEKQKVEILKQLYLDRRFLILDEPTSVLTPGEADEVLGMLRAMARAGRLTILMITHKFREVMAYADEVSVLRRGAYVGGGMVGDLDPAAMAKMMVGADEPPAPAARTPHEFGPVRLSIATLRGENDGGELAVHDVDLAVRGGEIVGIAGVSGNGQRELMEMLAGQRRPLSGTMAIDGQPYHGKRGEMTAYNLRCLPEEPLKNACVGEMSVAENMAFRDFDRAPFAQGGWWLNAAALRARARDLIARYRVKTQGPDAPIRSLSGGNVQRAVLAREIGDAPDVLVVANPCFGLDFAAVADIRGQIVAARNRGAAVLLISEDLDEILELADNVAVMFDGRIVYRTPIGDARMAAIGRAMAGHPED